MKNLLPRGAVAFVLIMTGWLGLPATAQAPSQPVPNPAPILNPVQPAPAPPAKAPRMRGRVKPANLDALRAASFARHGARLKALPNVTLTSFDSRTLGIVGPIKDQGQCGSCWDFSGTGVVEVAYNKAGVGGGANTFVLSEQYTLGCYNNGGCSGDDNTTVLDHAKSTGLPLSSAYGPYTASGGFFTGCNSNASMTLYKIPDWGFADSNGGQGVTSVQDIKNAIYYYGCVGVGIAANSAFQAWGDNNPSFDQPFTGGGFGSQNIDHDVILVGWKDDTTLSGGGYWILRNSWGTSWGVNGYMAICYGANLVGTEAVFALPPASPNPGPTPPPTPTPTPTPTSLIWALGPNAPSGAALDTNGNFTWTIPANAVAGNYVINFTVTPNGGTAANGSFTIVVSSNSSGTVTIAPIPNQSALIGGTFNLGLGQYVTTHTNPGAWLPPQPAPQPNPQPPLRPVMPLPQTPANPVVPVHSVPVRNAA